jgi:oxygen-independent coproporphyrinogen-3 oxidase
MTQTDSSTPAPAPLALQGDTTAGNIFISNYPPFSFWKPESVPEFHAALDRAPAPGNPLGLYLHIPFCRKRCHFCYFRVYTGVKSEEIRSYIEAALTELRLYASKAFVGGRKPKFIYFGGGTPSFLSTSQLEYLVNEMKAILPWDEAEEVAFECEPGTLTDKKIELIRSLGVTRLSLGVENFDAHILEINGRAHRAEEIDRAYNAARAAGFPQINIDLIAGMVEETEANWQLNIERTLERQPDSVTIYQMEVPFNTTIYKRMKEEGKLSAPVADWATKRRWTADAFSAFEKAGYRIASAYTAVRKDKPVSFVYRDRLWEGADLLSLGVASFGHIGGTHYQNHHDMGPYLERVNRGEFPVYRAYTPDEEERLIRETILQFKLGYLNPAYFQKKFGVDIRERFAGPFSRLREGGFLAEFGDTIRLTRDGLLQVDRLLMEFFLPRHQGQRYA